MKLNARVMANILLMLFVSIITLFFADIVVGKIKFTQYYGKKTYIQHGTQWGNCYPALNETHLPLRITDPNTGQDASCVIYDKEKRKSGFFPERAKTIALIGDSFTFGEGIGEKETLGYLLGNAFDSYNFLNFGQPGTDITYMYQVVSYLLKKEGGIHHIIYFYNINDMLMNKKISDNQMFIIDFQNLRWDNVKTKGPAWLSKSNIYRLVQRAYILRKESALTVQNYLDMYNPSLNESELNKTVLLLKAMAQAAESQDVGFTVIMYPLLYKTPKGEYPFKPIHHLMARVCQQYHIPFIDAYPAFMNKSSLKELIVHPLDYHPNGEANKLVVDYLKQLNNKKSIF